MTLPSSGRVSHPHWLYSNEGHSIILQSVVGPSSEEVWYVILWVWSVCSSTWWPPGERHHRLHVGSATDVFLFFLSNRFAISWRGEWVLQAVLFWDVGGWAEMGMELLIRWLRMMHMDYFWGQRGIRCCPDHYVVWRSQAFQNQLDIGSEAKRLQHHMTSALHEQKYIRLCTAGADVIRL